MGVGAVVLALLGASTAAGCRKESGDEIRPAREGATVSAGPRLETWGRGVPEEVTNFTGAALARNAEDPSLAEALASEGAARHAAVWTAMRIGGPELIDLALEVAARGEPDELGALGLLSPRSRAPGEPFEPADAWSELEDTLWTRYAVTEAPTDAEALVLAIGRVGGSASVSRFAIDLARPPADDADTARWVAAMRGLGQLCARGHALDEVARDAVGQGLGVPNPEARAAAAWTLWRCVEPSAEVLSLAAERKVLVDRLAKLLDDGDEEAAEAWKALAALAELPDGAAEADFEALVADGGRGEATRQRPWWVEVEVVRALAATADGRKVLRARLREAGTQGVSGYAGARAHVLLEMLRQLRAHVAGDDELSAVIEALLARLDGSSDASRRDERIRLLVRCQAESLRASKRGDLGALESCGADDVLGPSLVANLAVEALLDMGDAMPKDQRVAALLSRASDRRGEVAAPALAALAEIDDEQAKEVLRRALEREDAGVLAAAAGAIAARSIDASRRDLAVVPSLEVLARRTEPPVVEARLAAIEALGALGRSARTGVAPKEGTGELPPRGTTPSPEASDTGLEAPWLEAVILPLATDPSAAVRERAHQALLGHEQLLASFERAEQGRPRAANPAFERPATSGEGKNGEVDGGAGTTLHFVTEAGDFDVRLGGGRAPVNERHLVELARAGFYEGLRVHRVVPGFVVQGGDPRGDGYGGPGYLVPCEYGNAMFQRGVVGIATAGKDTGGSQFFVTQTRQPHLDARYTVVGKVVAGMDVVDALLPYDQILRVEVRDDADVGG